MVLNGLSGEINWWERVFNNYVKMINLLIFFLNYILGFISSCLLGWEVVLKWVNECSC